MFHHNAEIKSFSYNDDYTQFLKCKERTVLDSGFNPTELNENLFDFQRDIVAWALRKGRVALFEDTGLGKTLQQLAWADAVYKHEHKNVLIIAPLAVSKQTVEEGKKFGIDVEIQDSNLHVLLHHHQMILQN